MGRQETTTMYGDAFDDERMTPRRWLQRERGLCSDPDCDEPIMGWCATCDTQGAFKAPKLCRDHLMLHMAWTGHHPYLLYDDDPPSAPARPHTALVDPDDGGAGGAA
jgi:hypothetical protein